MLLGQSALLIHSPLKGAVVVVDVVEVVVVVVSSAVVVVVDVVVVVVEVVVVVVVVVGLTIPETQVDIPSSVFITASRKQMPV